MKLTSKQQSLKKEIRDLKTKESKLNKLIEKLSADLYKIETKRLIAEYKYCPNCMGKNEIQVNETYLKCNHNG